MKTHHNLHRIIGQAFLCLLLLSGIATLKLHAAPAPEPAVSMKAELERKIVAMIEAIVKAQPEAAVSITTAAVLAAPEFAEAIIEAVVRTCPPRLAEAVRSAGLQAVAQAAAAASQPAPGAAIAAPPAPPEPSKRNPAIPPPPQSPVIVSPN